MRRHPARRLLNARLGAALLAMACGGANEQQRATTDSTSPRLPAIDAAPDTAVPAADSATAAVAVVRAYYDAINARDYARAYLLWEGEGRASGQTFDAFRQGFDRTASVQLTVGAPGRIEGAAGSRFVDVPVEIAATQRDGTVHHFRGEYVLRRSVVPGASNTDWRLYSAKLRPI